MVAGTFEFTPKEIERFFAKLKPQEECLIWTGSRDKYGYGMVANKRIVVPAHVAAFYLHFGQMPEGMGICHSCDNPPCCEPSHLWAGDQFANLRDCITKGRNFPPPGFAKGSAHLKAKLTEEQVAEIRSLADVPIRQLGKRFVVNHGTISNILNGKSWKHMETK
jgi:hypothetical protein